MAETAAIQTNGLSKTYGRITALRDLTMSVPRGEIFGFLGPNGAGKTTAVKLLLELSPATSGKALVLGAPAGDDDERAVGQCRQQRETGARAYGKCSLDVEAAGED